MNRIDERSEAAAPAAKSLEVAEVSAAKGSRIALALGGVIALAGAFTVPLVSLFAYAAGSEVHSHILLVPLISAYVLYVERGRLPGSYCSSPWIAFMLAATGLLALAYGIGVVGHFQLSENDRLTLTSLAFVCLLVAIVSIVLGKRWLRGALFPIAFLIFMVPLPDAAISFLETASKLASAEVASWFFDLSGTPILRDGLVFQLPGITIEVAQECSGIRSSLVLAITSLLASHLFLETGWRKFVLVAFVIPLGVIRNGFRILVIGLLCVHVGPEMIGSPIHKQGGPLFFALSLIPLFLFLWWLRRGERGRIPAKVRPRDASVSLR